MESFGNILKKKREELGIDIEKVEREITISKKYIDAIENERVDVFPGETYFKGFLSNYASYLGEDPKKMLELYRMKKIQLSPIPEGLIVTNNKKKWLPWVISSVVLLVAIGVLLFFVLTKKDTEEEFIITSNIETTDYILTEEPLQKRLFKGDEIRIYNEKEEIVLAVDSTKDALLLDTPIGLQAIDLGEEVEILLDQNNRLAIIVYVLDISKNEENRGAEVRMFVKSSSAVKTSKEVVTDVMELSPQDTSIPQNAIIVEDIRAYPFTLNLTFRGSSLLRYQSDKNAAVEEYFSSDDTLVIQGHNAVRLWMSNSNSVKIQVIADGKSFELEIGRPGQVLVNEIRWVKDLDGKYKLVVAEID